MSLNGSVESNVLRGRIADPDVIHGLSAYEIDVMHGYDGTEEEWLKYVRGDFNERVEEAKAEFDNEVDNVIVPEAKAELERAKTEAVTSAVDTIETAETDSLSALSKATESHKTTLENAAAVLDQREVLLWENADLGSEDGFEGQTLNLQGKITDDIDHLRLVFCTRVGTVVGDKVIPSEVLPSIEVERGQTGRIHFDEGKTYAAGEYHSQVFLRNFTVLDGGNVQFEGADPNNYVCIPYRIYGVKNTLINLSGSPARIGEVNLTASGWVAVQGSENLYAQVVEIDGVTENSQVDLTPSVEQLAVFYNKDLAFVTENEDGVVTVYAIGQKPQNDYAIQVTIKEVSL